MVSDSDQSSHIMVNGIPYEDRLMIDGPTTPLDDDTVIPLSQQSIPATEMPDSPLDHTASFRSDSNDDLAVPTVIPSSLTPPPSSQVPGLVAPVTANGQGFTASQHSGIVSPPETGLAEVKREDGVPGYMTPTQQQISEASPETLRRMLQSLVAEHAQVKMQAAHHRMQNVLLTFQAQEDANRAQVEHELTRREVDVLQKAESARQARREISTATETAQARYMKLESLYKDVVEENKMLNQRLRGARKVLEERANEIATLQEDREILLNRIRENREHFHILCSPGGMFHGALTPKVAQAQSPQQHRATPRQTPRSAQKEPQHRGHGHNLADLLEALSQDNNSAPSTPITGHRPRAAIGPKHTRNVQSMSSLPTTPVRFRSDNGGLLPSVDLVPQTEPPQRFPRFLAQTPTAPRSAERRRSRESTISADDNEELARQALKSITTGTSFAPRASVSAQRSRGSQRDEVEEEQIYESQASQAASEMLRRDPRESFEVAASAGNSRDGTPAAADKSARLQAKLFGPLNKRGGALSGSGKRKFSEGMVDGYAAAAVVKSKKMRDGRVGLGIQYSQQEA
ncbi:hypothetical protein QBC40DRAFT_282232 [Triangularia verruculosa]|uniref:FAD-dependent oxidoreductase-like enzyme n=1 Tax=Triangularia verruculosa TaxID=2587418 RepID=A0AAN7ATZ0_9PEZI|nr:hypothetical protein QBC40DRAFT_282232 [Triangularia verruculosa]